MSRLILAPGKEKSLFRRHPWIFAGSVDRLEGRARAGDTVEIVAADGRLLARGAYSPASQIRARVWSFDENETIDDAFFKRRVQQAFDRRMALPELAAQQGLRVLHGESDGLPGVIADKYRDTIVLQVTSAGAEKWREAIARALIKATGAVGVYERSDSEVRKLEGLEPRTGWLIGDGEPHDLAIEEYGITLGVDIVGGHKTGFYLDQRENRRLTRALSLGRRVLNCFCYTGGFSLQALAGGAREVISIDSSAPALAAAARNLQRNPHLDAARAKWQEANVFDALREFKAAGERFDLIILDPPKFAPSAAHADRAARAYKDINLLGFRLLNPGGLLMTYSCSGGIGQELFQKIIASSASDAGVTASITHRLSAAADHPIGLAFPEGEYLKGLACQVG
jgi:23S rRNA (cytosine1962-C5)-methyltransferase